MSSAIVDLPPPLPQFLGLTNIFGIIKTGTGRESAFFVIIYRTWWVGLSIYR